MIPNLGGDVRSWFVIAAAISLATTFAATGAPAAPPATNSAQKPSPAKFESAIALARLAQPEDVVVAASINAFDQAFIATLKKEGSFDVIEAKFPGFTRKFLLRAKPIVETSLRKRMPALWECMAEVYGRELTSAQIAQISTFLGSPVGRKFIRDMNRKADVSAMVDDMAKSDGELSKDGFRNVTQGAAVGALAEMTPQEIIEFHKFGSGELMLVMKRVGPLVMEVNRAWANESDPEADKQISELMPAVMEELASSSTSGTSN